MLPELLDAILQVFPLDTYVEHPFNLMQVMPGDTVETPIWDKYREILKKGREKAGCQPLPESFSGCWRSAYERLDKAHKRAFWHDKLQGIYLDPDTGQVPGDIKRCRPKRGRGHRADWAFCFL